MSRYWPPIIPSVASASSRATSDDSYAGEPERLREQRVAREDADALAELLPGRGLAAPLLVVVDRGQVVVDERERVDELDRERRRHHLLDRRAERLADASAITGRTRLPPTSSE